MVPNAKPKVVASAPRVAWTRSIINGRPALVPSIGATSREQPAFNARSAGIDASSGKQTAQPPADTEVIVTGRLRSPKPRMPRRSIGRRG